MRKAQRAIITTALVVLGLFIALYAYFGGFGGGAAIPLSFDDGMYNGSAFTESSSNVSDIVTTSTSTIDSNTTSTVDTNTTSSMTDTNTTALVLIQ